MKMEDPRVQLIENAKWVAIHLDEDHEDFKFLARLLGEVAKDDERDPDLGLLDVVDGLPVLRDKLEAVGKLLRQNQMGLSREETRGIGEIVGEVGESLDDIARDANAAYVKQRAKKANEAQAEVAQ